MASRWFRLDETGTGTLQDPFKPNFHGHNVTGYSGNKSHPQGSPIWVTKVYGTISVLDSLSTEQQSIELGSVPKQVLDNMFNDNRTEAEWDDAFKVISGV